MNDTIERRRQKARDLKKETYAPYLAVRIQGAVVREAHSSLRGRVRLESDRPGFAHAVPSNLTSGRTFLYRTKGCIISSFPPLGDESSHYRWLKA